MGMVCINTLRRQRGFISGVFLCQVRVTYRCCHVGHFRGRPRGLSVDFAICSDSPFPTPADDLRIMVFGVRAGGAGDGQRLWVLDVGDHGRH